ncbi:hypothetical protein A3B18_03710 [Candidatus Giovannonibacteria bacterium RIFCSPLOWO2_01_FULL_46_13]|uniref:Uncharacterized protein n=1 Tax=Candidatus Giovannonibacteria bacterium RIFCSPLOWO2_01_FULL_46_13 TaxID=1798352 RepID=A0A1F5X4C2_9BACT|nr:MAG: hypothetical protein A3B18_03710 [Candidatus Giovannonibacteria bacterium RIFCSPLOWO2_01_FULL_46_13]
MNVEKCDICRKVIGREKISLSYASKNSMRQYKDLCQKCGKSILDFIKKNGWWKKVEEEEKSWAALRAKKQT